MISRNPHIHRVIHRTTAVFTIIVALALPQISSAAIVYSQTHDNATASGGSSYQQINGATIAGTAGYVAMKFRVVTNPNGSTVNAAFRLYVRCFTGTLRNTNCANSGSAPFFADNAYVDSEPVAIVAGTGQDYIAYFNVGDLGITYQAGQIYTFGLTMPATGGSTVNSGESVTPSGGSVIVIRARGSTTYTPPSLHECWSGDCYTSFNEAWIEISSTPYVVDTTTRIIDITPANAATIATSTTATIGGEVYINPADYMSGMYYRIKFARYSSSQASVANIEGLYTTFDFPLVSGLNSLSTTTPITAIGKYTMQSQIRKPSITTTVLSWFGLTNLYDGGKVMEQRSTFIASQLNGFDTFVASTTAAIDTYLASSTISMASCTSWTSFAFSDCLALLFVPQAEPIGSAFEDFKNGFLSYAPIGYITRVAEILSNSATTTLPDVTYTFDDEFPVEALQGQNFTFSPWEHLFVSGSILNDQLVSRGDDPKNVWEIFEQLITLIVYMTLAFMVLKDLTHIHPQRKSDHL